MRAACKDLLAAGWQYLKLKVGANLADDIRRCKIARETVGPDFKIMVDANQKWDVQQAVEWMQHLAPFNPWWIEEPTIQMICLDTQPSGNRLRQFALQLVNIARTGFFSNNSFRHRQLMSVKLTAAGSVASMKCSPFY